MFNNLNELTDEELAALEKKIQARKAAETRRVEELKRKLANYSFDLGFSEQTLSDVLESLYKKPELLDDYDISDKLEEIEAACSDLEGMVTDLESLIDEREED